MRGKYILPLMTLAVIFAALLVPAGAQDAPETLVVYSGRSEGLIGPILTQFSEETGIQVEVRYGSTSEMAATILEEGDNSPADVYIAQDAGALGALAAAGRLTALPSDVLERVPAPFASENSLWVGLSGRARVLVYNTDLVQPDELPDSILELTEPEWKGRLGWAPTNASLQAHVTAMRVLLGEEATRTWLEGIIANDPVTFEGNSPVVQAVINGEIAVGLVNHYYLFGFLRDNPNIAAANYYFPAGDVGSLINIAGAGVLNTSDRPGLAQRLILYLLGNTAQQYFADQTFEYPMIPGIDVNPVLTPLEAIEAPSIDLSQLSDLQTTLDLLRDTGAIP